MFPIPSRPASPNGIAVAASERHGFAAIAAIIMEGGHVPKTKLPLLQDVILHLAGDLEAYDVRSLLPKAKQIVTAVNEAPAGTSGANLAKAIDA